MAQTSKLTLFATARDDNRPFDSFGDCVEVKRKEEKQGRMRRPVLQDRSPQYRYRGPQAGNRSGTVRCTSFGDCVEEKQGTMRRPVLENRPPQHAREPKTRQRTLTFDFRTLRVGIEYQVCVSHLEDEGLTFSLQVASEYKTLKELMKEINEYPVSRLREPPVLGSACLGRYSLDRVLCRAAVMSATEKECKLYYVDFGHIEVLPYSEIFQLPPQFINPMALSIRFTLSGLKHMVITQSTKDYFREMVTGKVLLLRVRPSQGHPVIHYGDLYDNGISIRKMLEERCDDAPQVFRQPSVALRVIQNVDNKINTGEISEHECDGASQVFYEKPLALYRGFKDLVHVSFVESCTKFFVQLDRTIVLLNSLMASFDEYANNAPKLDESNIKVGWPCCALYATDMHWYRAEILSVKGDQVAVLFVDYGNEEVVASSTLRKIPNYLVTNLTPQAIRCVLNGSDESPVNQELSDQFELLVIDKKLAMEVICIRPDNSLVDLFDREVPPRVRIASKLQFSNPSKPKNSKNPDSKHQSGDKSARNSKPNPKAESLPEATDGATSRSTDSLNPRREFPRRMEKMLKKWTKYVR